MRCIRNIWLPSGLQIRLISIKISRIGRNSMRKKNTSSSMCSPSLLPPMALSLRIWLDSFAPRFRSQKQDAFTDSRLRWKTCTLRLTPCWLTPISRMSTKNFTSSRPLQTLMLSKRRHSGQWSGWTEIEPSKRDWWPLQLSKAFSFRDHFVPSSGWKKDHWCLDSPFLTNWFQETKVCTQTSPATSTHWWKTN